MSSVSDEHRPYIGVLMRVSQQWVVEHVYSRVIAAGFDDLGRFHLSMFRFPTSHGLRPTELADRLQITKQSVNDLLRDMEEWGYLAREPDPTDRRARVIELSDRGRRLEQVVFDASRSAELAIGELLGPRAFTQLRHCLEAIVSNICERDLARL